MLNGPKANTNYLNRLFDFFSKWGMRLNMDKTNSIIFKLRRRGLYPNCRRFVPSLYIGGGLVRNSDKRYPGMVFHENLRFYRHIDYILNRVRKIYYNHKVLLQRSGGLSRKVRLLVYKQIVSP